VAVSRTAEGAAPRLSRRRRRQLVLSGEYGIFLVVVVALLASADWHEIHANFANWSIAKQLFPDVITIGLRNTLIFTVTGFALGLAGGLVLALIETDWGKDRLRQLIVSQTARFLNGTLEIDSLDGSLFRGIHLRGVRKKILY